ncbi:MAG: nucleotidyltransferase substrate binding protein [Gracilibacteraceae bacterium]|jgi:nucleotidyltransferase substrate binding protein (TIGR01987 family)|nr:nucleotidyltransferase substrate binding protein [Gracilibacteraceae bacterium]
MDNQDIRWRQRFENFSKACALLSEINGYELNKTPPIIREGFIQRFEITFDLAWKTVNDYLRYLGHDVQPSPRPVIKEAFAANVIVDGQAFINMLEARNETSHRYDEGTFNKIFQQIKSEFYPALEGLRVYLEVCAK